MRRRSFVPPLVAVLTLSACQQTDDGAENRSAVLDSLNHLRDRHVSAILNADVDEELATYSESAVVIPPGQPVATGAQEIRAWLEGTFASISVEQLEIRLVDPRVGQDQAIAQYRYTWSVALDGSEPVPDTGAGLWVVERGADGRWLIAYDVWNSDGGGTGSHP